MIFRKAATSLLSATAFKVLCFSGFFFVLYLPIQGLIAQEAADAIIFDSEVWRLKQLPVIRLEVPEPTAAYEVFTISKNNLGKWIIGGNLKNPNAELIYVDRKNRLIGPFTSSVVDSQGTRLHCLASKATSKIAQQNSGRYNGCGSDFYSADTVEKLTQMVISCAILACLGGNSVDWNAVFRPIKLKKALVSSELMAQIKAHYHAKESQFIDARMAFFNDKTNYVLSELNAASIEGIGAVLTTEDEYTKVSSIIPGGPADLQGIVQPEDTIVGVAQGEDEIVDVVGWRLDEVIDLIRGSKGSTVRLRIIANQGAASNSIKVIAIRRGWTNGPQDAVSLRASLKALNGLSNTYSQYWKDFSDEISLDSSLAFSLGNTELITTKIRTASQASKSTYERISKLQQLHKDSLNKIEVAERAIVRKIQALLKHQIYYTSSVDGLFGPGTLAAIKALSVDITLPPGRGDKEKILQAVKASFMEPEGSCSKSSSDGAHMVCFSLE
jgi:hypothetical protein